MRLAFAGTPEFAQTALAALLQAGLTPAVVLTQPDRPAGRGMREQPSPVKQLAQAHGIAVLQPRSLRLDGRFAEDARAAQAELAALDLDVMVVAAYGLILPAWVLELPRLGCLNIHASLLPRWRGAAPIHRAIEAGDTQTGISIMQMDEGLDTGDTIEMTPLAIGADETTAELHDRLATLGGQCIVRVLQQCPTGPTGARVRWAATPQPEAGVSYAHKISRAESALDWRRSAEALARQIRAFNPFPAAQAEFLGALHAQEQEGEASARGETLKIWRAHAIAPEAAAAAAAGAQPGQILSVDRKQGIVVACGQGALCLTELQRAGGKRLQAGPFLSGFAMAAGDRFALPH